MATIIHGGKIFTEDGVFAGGAVAVERGKITSVGSAEKILSSPLAQKAKIISLPASYMLIPGFIDMHIHGAAGSDIMDGDFKALTTMSAALAKEGVTSFLGATAAEENSAMEKALSNVAAYKKQIAKNSDSVGAEILGINLEAPFLSPQKAGALDAKYFLPPQIETITRWQSLAGGLIKSVAVAPELKGAIEFIKYLKKQKINVALGHSEATFNEAAAAIKAGASHANHLFNAMHAIHQREPGLSLALLLGQEVSVELIVDNVHLYPAMVALVLAVKNPAKIILITDAMRAKGLSDGEYELGGKKVLVKDGQARLSDGTLAGSILTMSRAVKNLVAISKKFTNVELDENDIVKMATLNPATKLRVTNRKGSIAIDKDADLVALDKNYEVKLTMCRGKIAYQDM